MTHSNTPPQSSPTPETLRQQLSQMLADGPDLARITAELTALVQLPSVNPFERELDEAAGDGEAAIAAHYDQRLQELGFTTEQVEVAPGRVNVYGRLPGTCHGPSVIFAGHLDTVDLEGTLRPFSADVEDGRLYGRGSCDMKAGLVAYLEVARLLQKHQVQLPGDLLIAGLCDEEHLMQGSHHYAANASATWRADYAILGEPTRLTVCPTHNGQITFRVRTHGLATHSSRPENGANAITAMAQLITGFAAYATEVHERTREAPGGGGRSNVGVISGGTITSTVPDFCEIEVDRRTIAGESAEQVRAELQAIIDATALDPRITVELIGPDININPLSTPTDSPVVQELLAAHRAEAPEAEANPEHLTPALFAGATDAPNMGCPSVVCGPGDPKNAHSIDEYVELDEVMQAVRLYLRTIVGIMAPE